MKDDAALIWEAYQPDDGKELGIHTDPHQGEGPLSEYGLEVVEGRDDDGDRYWETWEIRATTRDAIDRYGHGTIDWVYQSEMPDGISIQEIEQKVMRNLHNHGKPLLFRGYTNSR